MYKEKKKKRLKKISVPAIAIFLVLISVNIVNAALSNDNISENISVENFGVNVTNTNNITDNISNNTSDQEGLGWPDLRITTKYVSPSKVRPGNTAILGLTISEVRGDDWAKDVTAIVEILNPDGTSFSETGTSRAEHYLGNIGRSSSASTSFVINIPDYAQLGQRTIKVTIRWYETGWIDLGTFGPYYIDSSVDFTVTGIKVTSPNGGENWQRDTINSITWNNYIEGQFVKIELLKGGILNKLISSSTLNDGSLDWYISADQPTGNDYKIRITSTSDPTFIDTSDSNFIISSPSLIIIVPNGGENWERGITKTIAWEWNYIGNVKIELLKGGILDSVIAPNIQNDGSFDWYVPTYQSTGNDYKVKITSTSNPAYTDISDNNFIISSQAYLTVLSPNGGEDWPRSSTKSITWTYNGNLGSNVRIELLKGGTLDSVISSGTPNDGSYSWTIPSTQALGNDYKIRIAGSLGYSDTSDDPFTISFIQYNLLKNPGFEESYGTTPKYWSKSQTGTKAIFTYPETGRAGKSVAIKYPTKDTGKVALWQQTGIIVVPSKQYKLSGYMKLESVTGGSYSCGRPLPCTNGAGLRVNWLSSSGAVIKTDIIYKSGTTNVRYSGTMPWTKYEGIFTAPSNAVKASIGGDLFNTPGKVWFDDLSFVKVS